MGLNERMERFKAIFTECSWSVHRFPPRRLLYGHLTPKRAKPEPTRAN
jgi:hypothetical protein